MDLPIQYIQEKTPLKISPLILASKLKTNPEFLNSSGLGSHKEAVSDLPFASYTNPAALPPWPPDQKTSNGTTSNFQQKEKSEWRKLWLAPGLNIYKVCRKTSLTWSMYRLRKKITGPEASFWICCEIWRDGRWHQDRNHLLGRDRMHDSQNQHQAGIKLDLWAWHSLLATGHTTRSINGMHM